MLKLTKAEEDSLKDYIEYHFIESIRQDEEIDSLLYVYNILNIYRKLGGLEQFSDYEPDTE